MKKIIFIAVMVLLVNLSLVSAITQQEINEAKNLIDSKTNCKSLSDSQLEIIGEYLMEQMHPGESHELMHKMMGMEEGSKEEEQFHINMAKTMYCSEGGMMGSGGMMNMMGQGMMGSGGMMGMMNTGNNMMGQGMMSNYGYRSSYWSFLNVLSVILLIGLIILIYLWIVKLWKDIF